MARYTGPKSRIARRFGEPIFGPDKALARKAYGPGQHGNQRRRGKQSEYGAQLMEKQKAKFTYGILEKQFSNLFKEALRMKGVTGENLLQMCEMRLDNVVFRLGIAPTRRAARQLVTHNHITVNGNNINVPSFALSLFGFSKPEIILKIISLSIKSLFESLPFVIYSNSPPIGED